MANPLAKSYLNEETELDDANYVNWNFKMHTLMEGYKIQLIPEVVVGATTTII